MQRFDLVAGFCELAFVLNDVVGDGQAFAATGLGVDHTLCLSGGFSVSFKQSSVLGFLTAVDHKNTIHAGT